MTLVAGVVECHLEVGSTSRWHCAKTPVHGRPVKTRPVSAKAIFRLVRKALPSADTLLSVNGIAYQLTIFFTKLSILLLYLRIFSVHKTFALITTISIAIITIFYIPLIGVGIGFIVACHKQINFTKSHFCRTYNGPVLFLNGSFNVVTDIWLLVLPFPLLMKLRLQPRHRLGLITVFAAGTGAFAASLARLIELAVNFGKPDPIWSQILAAEFSIAEINIGIIVACVSTFPIFFGQVRNWLRLTGNSKPTQIKSSESGDGQVA
ncbi:hypothetical protein FHL15_009694 [Xylaria flabelliformis]|uniref:Rhodopsin domain-containing protein n=1 Tax=Xylaria flabelliformis TaxID=2512241 RepID=A0A553HN92_9PEZI|nr:hypothetical protein FHL15_009694 [Xylaria flabelliformis]